MTNAPNRIDLTSASLVMGQMFQLKDDDIKLLETTGNITLTDFRDDINHAIDQYIRRSGINKNGLRREDIASVLTAFQKSVALLYEFFAEESESISKPVSKAAREKIEAELYPPENEGDTAKLIKGFERIENTVGMTPQILQQLQEQYGIQTEPLVNTNHFFNELSSLKDATEKAISKFEMEGVEDKGSRPSDDAKNILLAEIDNIFKLAGGTDACRDRFFYHVIKVIPTNYRPMRLDSWNWATISKRINRAR